MTDLAQTFLELHQKGKPLLLPNAYDRGSARLFEEMGFQAIATTSSGHAGTLGQLDGAVTPRQALEHARDLAAATQLPVSADLENGFGDTPKDVGETVQAAIDAGLAGCSIEDFSRDGQALYDPGLARERMAAAIESAGKRIVVTARAENHIHGVDDLADTIGRLQSFQEVGAPVLYAPGLVSRADIESVVSSVDRPVNFLLRPGAPDVAELAEIGIARVSVGGAFYFASLAATEAAARELLDAGSSGFWQQAGPGVQAAHRAFEK